MNLTYERLNKIDQRQFQLIMNKRKHYEELINFECKKSVTV